MCDGLASPVLWNLWSHSLRGSTGLTTIRILYRILLPCLWYNSHLPTPLFSVRAKRYKKCRRWNRTPGQQELVKPNSLHCHIAPRRKKNVIATPRVGMHLFRSRKRIPSGSKYWHGNYGKQRLKHEYCHPSRRHHSVTQSVLTRVVVNRRRELLSR